jgi:hypothetical protein
MDEMTAKMRYCWNCGAEMGVIEDHCYVYSDTCHKYSCRRAEREQPSDEIRDAYRHLDRAFDYL